MKKKRIIISSLALLLAGAGLVSCTLPEDNPGDDIGGETLKYTIKFVDEDGTELKKEELASGATITAPEEPTKEGFTFSGWDYNDDGVVDTIGTVTENRTYKAIYVQNADVYTVTFKADGTTVATLTYTEESPTVTAPAVPEKAGYTGAWETYELTTGNKEVNAVYTTIEYTVTFKADGKVIGTDIYTVEDKDITAPRVPTKEGYTGAWEAYDLTIGDKEVNAEYTLNEYTVTFRADNTVIGTDTYTVEDKDITIPAVPAKEGYTGVWDTYTLNTGNKTVVAIYTIITYTVTFMADNQIIGTDNYTVEDKGITDPDVPQKRGHTATWEKYTLTTGDKVVNAIYKLDCNPDLLGKYFFTDANNVESSLELTESGIIYTKGKEVFTTYSFDSDYNVVMTLNNDETAEFTYDSKIGKFLLGDDAFGKAIPAEWVGTYISSGSVLVVTERDAKYYSYGVESNPIITSSGLTFGYNTFEYNAGETTPSFGTSFMTMSYVDDSQKSTQIKEEWYGKYLSNNEESVVFAEDSVTYTTNENTYTNYVIYTWTDSEGAEYATILFDECFLWIELSKMNVSSVYASFSLEFDKDIITTIPSEHAYKTYACDEVNSWGKTTTTTLQFTASGVVYNESNGFDMIKYNVYSINDGVITIFKQSPYTLMNAYVTFEFVDGKFVRTKDGKTAEFAEANIQLSSIKGDYQAENSDVISITADSITYLGIKYELADITISGYAITFGGHTLEYKDGLYEGSVAFTKVKHMSIYNTYGTYKCGLKTLTISYTGVNYDGVDYKMSTVKVFGDTITFGDSITMTFVDSTFTYGDETYGKINNMYGTYRVGADNSKVIVFSADNFEYNGTSYIMSEVSYVNGVFKFGEGVQVNFSDGTFISGEDTYTKVTNISLYTAYGTYRYGTDNKDLIIVSSEGIVYAGNKYLADEVKIVGNDIIAGNVTFVYANDTLTVAEKKYDEVISIKLTEVYGTYMNGTDSIIISSEGVTYKGALYDTLDVMVVGNEILLDENTIVYSEGSIVADEKTYSEVSQYFALYKNTTGDSIRFSVAGIEFGGHTYPLAEVSYANTEFTFGDKTVTFGDKVATIDGVQYDLYIEVNAEVYGTYEEVDYGYKLILSEGSISLISERIISAELVSYDTTTNDIVMMVKTSTYYNPSVATFLYDSDTKMYFWDERYLDLELQDPLKPYYGTYNDATYTLVINAEGVSMTYGDATSTSYEAGQLGRVEITMSNGDVLTLSYTDKESVYSFTLAEITVTLPKFVYKVQQAWIGSWNASFLAGSEFTLTADGIILSDYFMDYYDFTFEVLDENSFLLVQIAGYGDVEYVLTYNADSDTFSTTDEYGNSAIAERV